MFWGQLDSDYFDRGYDYGIYGPSLAYIPDFKTEEQQNAFWAGYDKAKKDKIL